jgi:endonuclease/exonuclease/phosphatase (EEP) superfamily protein YafD
MAQELKTIQWNIGGGKLLREGANPARLSSYTEDGLKSIIDLIGQEEPDIVTLQETHDCDELCQPEAIADELGYEWVNDSWNESHIEKGQKLGQAILSKLPILNHKAELFVNPLWEASWEDQTVAVTHDKGITTCDVGLEERELRVQNLQLIPFHRFGINPWEDEESVEVLIDIENKIGRYDGPRIIQGDFNLDHVSLWPFLPGLLAYWGVKEVKQHETTVPGGRRLDHVLYSGMTVVRSEVIKKEIRTDHYPVITSFEI